MPAAKHILDFIVIGAQKAGTTSLYEYLRRHPELCLPFGKEAPYFSHDAMYARGWDDYLRRAFPLAGSAERKWGTVTPQYMTGGIYDAARASPLGARRYDERTVPLRIRAYSPEVRLIAILRDPVERALSHYQMAFMNRLERRSFEAVIDDLLRPESLECSRQCPEEATGYVTWGEYGRILAGYFDVFSREQIMILFTDELAHAPEQLLRRVYEFLGVSPNLMPDNLRTRYREGTDARRFSWLSPDALQNAATHNLATRAIWHTLPERSRRWVDHQFASIRYRLDLWNRVRGTDISPPGAATLTRLEEHFAGDADRLAALLDLALPWQRRLTA